MEWQDIIHKQYNELLGFTFETSNEIINIKICNCFEIIMVSYLCFVGTLVAPFKDICKNWQYNIAETSLLFICNLAPIIFLKLKALRIVVNIISVCGEFVPTIVDYVFDSHF